MNYLSRNLFELLNPWYVGEGTRRTLFNAIVNKVAETNRQLQIYITAHGGDGQ